MELIFLGSGTSTGVPVLRCHCPTCRSRDPRDKRLRASVLIRKPEGNIIIDCGPDFRRQLLRENSPELDAALLTHIHYDHVGGIDDLRPYCASRPNHHFPIFCRDDVAKGLRHNFPYSFEAHPYPGVPVFDLNIIEAGKKFNVAHKSGSSAEVLPLSIMHGNLPILGYRVGSLAYITDCSYMPAETIKHLQGTDTLVINALREEPHFSHLNLTQALELIEQIAPRRAYLTHMSHDTLPHEEAQKLLPDNVYYAYDGLRVTDIS